MATPTSTTRQPSQEIQDRLLLQIASAFLVPPDDLRRPLRTSHVVLARNTLCWSLQRLGLNPAQISRYLHRNHSSVIHALERMKGPDAEHARQIGRRVLTCVAAPDPLDAFAASITDLLPDPHARQAVLAYLGWTLLARRYQPAPLCVAGLREIAANRALREVIVPLLAHYNLESQIARIQIHIERQGYHIENLTTLIGPFPTLDA